MGGNQGAILQGSKLASPREVCWEVMKTEQKLADFRLRDVIGYIDPLFTPSPFYVERGLQAAGVSTELEKKGHSRSKTRGVSRALPIHSDSSRELSAHILNSSKTAESQSVTKRTISFNTLNVMWFSGALSSWALVKTYRPGLSVCMGLSEVRSHKAQGRPSQLLHSDDI